MSTKISTRISDKLNNECVELFAELLKNGKFVRTKTIGQSMYPTIKEEDYLLIEPIAFSDIKPGDIVAYRKSGEKGFITGHRAIKKIKRGNTSFLVAKGDANPFFDNPVYPEEVYGRVIKIEKGVNILDVRNMKTRISFYVYARFLWLTRYLRVRACSRSFNRSENVLK